MRKWAKNISKNEKTSDYACMSKELFNEIVWVMNKAFLQPHQTEKTGLYNLRS